MRVLRDIALIGLISLLGLEVALRVYNPIYLPVRADEISLPLDRTFTQRNINNPKVDELQTYTYNSLGMRGPSLPAVPSDYVKIVTVGGSTTACVEITDGKTWPDVAFARMQVARGNIWLNNAGQIGHSTFAHLILLERYLSKLPLDYVLYLVGVNDVGRDDLTEFDESFLMRRRSWRDTVIRSSELLSMAQALKRSYVAHDLGLNLATPLDLTLVENTVTDVNMVRQELNKHRDKHIPAYRLRVEQIVIRSKDLGLIPILITQPALYGKGIDPATGVALDDLVTPRSELPSAIEWEVLELYNDVVRDVSFEQNIPYLDLARKMPKDSTYYFDWIHFSNAGAQLVGEIVSAFMLSTLESSIDHTELRSPKAAIDG